MMMNSLSQGVLPLPLKEALVCTLFEKPLLEHTALDHFDPVSNFLFLKEDG